MKSFIFTVVVLLVLLASLALFYVDYGPVKLYPVLHYQHIESSESHALDYVNPLIFKLQMKYLYDNKFKVVPLEEVVKTYKHHGEIPKRTIALTFDGGYKDFIRNANPYLQKYRFPATVFLASGKIGTAGYMTKEDIIHLYEEGLVSFGSNGRGKLENLTRVAGAAAYEDIFISRSDMKNRLEIPIDYFSYPGGFINSALIHYVKECKYKGAVSMMPGSGVTNNHPYAIKRISMESKDGAGLKFKIKAWGNYVLFEEWRKKK